MLVGFNWLRENKTVHANDCLPSASLKFPYQSRDIIRWIQEVIIDRTVMVAVNFIEPEKLSLSAEIAGGSAREYSFFGRQKMRPLLKVIEVDAQCIDLRAEC